MIASFCVICVICVDVASLAGVDVAGVCEGFEVGNCLKNVQKSWVVCKTDRRFFSRQTPYPLELLCELFHNVFILSMIFRCEGMGLTKFHRRRQNAGTMNAWTAEVFPP